MENGAMVPSAPRVPMTAMRRPGLKSLRVCAYCTVSEPYRAPVSPASARTGRGG